MEQDYSMKTPFHNWLSSVQLLSRVRPFATPWIAARQASLPITNSRSLLKPMSIESVMPSSHLILCRPLLLRGLAWPNSLVSFSWWKSQEGMRRQRHRTNRTRGRPHLPQEGRHSGRPQASGHGTFHGAEAPSRTGPYRPVPAAHTHGPRRGLPARAWGTLHLKEAAFERLQGAVRPCSCVARRRHPRGERKGAALSLRRALSGAAPLRTTPTLGRWASRGRRA